MQSYRFSAVLTCALLPLMGAGGAGAQAPAPYPSKLMRIVTSAAGSTNDLGSRVIAQELTASIGQQVIVENRGGPPSNSRRKSPPDGYTMLSTAASVWLMPFLRAKA